jgi:hypothetical protein
LVVDDGQAVEMAAVFGAHRQEKRVLTIQNSLLPAFPPPPSAPTHAASCA